MLRKATALPANELTAWEQGFIAGGEPPLRYADAINRIRLKIEAFEEKHGPLSILDT